MSDIVNTETTKLTNQCKLCRMIHDYPELWARVHEMVLGENVSHTIAQRWLNKKIELLNLERSEEAQLKPFNGTNFSIHFNQHVTEELRVKHALNKMALGKDVYGSTGFSSAEKAVAEAFLQKYSKDVSEYTAMATMIDTVERRLKTYNEFLDKKELEQKNNSPNLASIAQYVELAEHLMKMRLDLSKMRNSSQVAGLAIEAATETAVKVFLDQLINITEEAKETLVTEMPGSNLPTEIVNSIRNRVGEGMKSSIPDIIKEIMKQFSIK